VLARARAFERLQRRVRALLPEPLARQCHVVGHSRDELRLLVDNPALATQLRFRRTELLAAIADTGAGPAAKLSIVVRPPSPEPPAPARRPAPEVPEAAGADLAGLALTESDPALRAALARLARRARSGV
jgi:hypothetical protein